MTNLNPSMRLKVNRDTFFVSDPSGGVYFRNNVSSFRMEGRTINQWIEKLLPMFNGEHSLDNLTAGLPINYRDRVYEIANVLYINGFVIDVSQDRPHQLADEVLKKYGSQIEFLDSLGNSGAYRFQTYRQSKVLAIGSGPFFVSLVAALLESGLPRFHVFMTEKVSTNRKRIMELVENARKTDPEVSIEEIRMHEEGKSTWRQMVKPFQSILYVSQDGNIEELRVLHADCREEKKVFIPAIFLNNVGMAGPLVFPGSEGCWESAWRRLHQSDTGNEQRLHISSTSGAIMANLIVFEWFKKVTGVNESVDQNQFFLLDQETLTGNWHTFMPHPLVSRRAAAEWVQDINPQHEPRSHANDPSRLFPFFSRLTSHKTGIFHTWEEGDLKQLPLSQCRVQAADLLSEGPAKLMPEIICTGLSHVEARREAGLAGIESYVTRLAGLLVIPSGVKDGENMIQLQEFVGFGAGESVAEGVCRGLQWCLEEELSKQQAKMSNSVHRLELAAVEDAKCRFYIQVLETMQGEPILGMGEEVFGFPVVWVGTKRGWNRSVGLNKTMALSKALQQSLKEVQNQEDYTGKRDVRSVTLKDKEPLNLVIPAYEETAHFEVLQSAIQLLEQKNKRLHVFELILEPLWKEELAGVFGVMLREEETH